MSLVVKPISPPGVQGRVAKDNPKRTIQGALPSLEGPPALLPQMAHPPLKFSGLPTSL
jgi:hypothetical protein